jgi:hypothetical protein
MDFYSVPLIINDRREKIINLYTQSEHITLYKHIIETSKNAHFHIVEFTPQATLKSFIENKADISLSACEFQFDLIANELKVKIYTQKENIVEPPIEATVAEEHTAPILSYEDLDLFEQVPKSISPQPIQPPTVTANSQTIGVWQDTIKIIAHNYSNGACLISGYITSNFENLLNINFKDLTLSIELHLNNEIFTNATTISFAHPEQFLGIALDFGSEASQMAIKRYNMEHQNQQMRPEIENLFKNILSFNKSKAWVSNDPNIHYYQEERNTNFYKSIFFLRSNLTGAYKNIYKDPFVADMPNNLKMLVNTFNGYQELTENNYHQLPNLKITQKYDNLFSSINFNIDKDGYDINVGLGVMKNKVYNSILKVMIESYLKKEFLLNENATRKIRFILLVPNIYDYYDIKNTQQLLHDTFQSLSEEEYKGKLLSWEIMTISESDASFLGYINKNDINIQKNKDYIIIDSGKGTTDLSIIRTGNQNVYNIKPIFRNGFAGAGNLLTFAVFETILHYIRANAAHQNDAFKFIKEKIVNVLNSNNLEVKNKIFEQLERLKFKYHDNSSYVSKQWEQANVGDTNFRNITEEGRADSTSTIRNILANIENISDFYGYIQDTCKVIATRTIQNIKLVKKNAETFDCGGVILSGRAFLFKPLEQIMRKMLTEEVGIPDYQIHLLNGNELKDICIKGVFNNSVRINAEKIGYPIQIVADTSSTKAQHPTERNEIEKPKKTIQSRLLKLFFNEMNDLESQTAVVHHSNTTIDFDSLFKSQFLIGGKRYKIVGNNIYNTPSTYNTDANILFTEKGYLVRKLENNVVTQVLELQEIFDTEDVELNMVIPSLFPNYIDEDFIHTFQSSIEMRPVHSAPIYFDFNKNTQNNNDKPKGPIYF